MLSFDVMPDIDTIIYVKYRRNYNNNNKTLKTNINNL